MPEFTIPDDVHSLAAREAERLGREIAEDEWRTVESETDREIPPTLYLGMDGTGIPMRKSETEGRAGKQEDGSAKTRKVKLVTKERGAVLLCQVPMSAARYVRQVRGIHPIESCINPAAGWEGGPSLLPAIRP